jgi:probable rRNA maturation factor
MQITSKHYSLFINDEEGLLKDSKKIQEKLSLLINKLDSNQQKLSSYNFENIQIELSVVDDKTIKEINSQHRQKDKVTDVLSFPAQDNIRNNEFEVLNNELILGDILVCHSVCEKQASEHNIDFSDEFLHLFVHGLLHLYGYDHEISDEEEKVMEEKELELIKLMQ